MSKQKSIYDKWNIDQDIITIEKEPKQKSYAPNYPIITKAKKDTWTKEWLVLLEEMYPEIIAMEGTEVMATMLGGVGIFDVENPNVQDFIDQWKIKLSFEIEDETQRLLKEEIKTGMEIGESIPEITARVQGLFEDMSTYRAQRIARTETIRASNYAAEESYRQSGVVTGKYWLIADDERTCGWCREMARRFNSKHPIGIGENFLNFGDTLSYTDEDGKKHTMNIDYTDIRNPGLHPHDRCCIMPVIDQTLYNEIMSEKKTFTLDELIGKGGKGSGNFSHSGREGHVGGSGLSSDGAIDKDSSGPVYVYRGEYSKLESQILEKGIQAKVWDKRKASVYMTTSEKEAHMYGIDKSFDKNKKAEAWVYAVVKIEIPEKYKSSLLPDEKDTTKYGRPGAVRIEKKVPKEWIKEVKKYTVSEKEYSGKTSAYIAEAMMKKGIANSIFTYVSFVILEEKEKPNA